VNCKSKSKQTPLHYASCGGQLEVVKYLKSIGATK